MKEDTRIDTKKESSMADTKKTETGKDKQCMTFGEAVEERYSHLVEDCWSPQVEQQTLGSSGADRIVQVVGLEKIQKQIRREPLTRLLLDRRRISQVGTISPPFQRLLSTVIYADLSYNDFSDWKTVVEIVSNLPSLKEIIVSGNTQLVPPTDVPLSTASMYKEKMKQLETIVLTKCAYKWSEIVNCASHIWPNHLPNLNLHGNDITELHPLPSELFLHLEFLDLSSNRLGDWREICRLSQLPRLKSLNLSDCQITTVSFEKNLFKSLEKLNISNNKLESWRDIAQFNLLPCLTDLNVKGNPVVCREEDYVRAFNLVLGRVAGLKHLNLEKITEEMVNEAERYYLRTTIKEGVKSDQEWIDANPSFHELVKKYGEVVDSVPVKAKHISLKLQWSDKDIPKRLPLSTKIFALKVMMKRIFGLGSTEDVKLIWKSTQDESFEYVLDDDHNSLDFYALSDGDIIVITQD